MWKSILAVWGSSSLAIGVVLYYTHDIRCLWFLLIPALMSFTSHNDKKDDQKDDKKDDPEGKN